MITDSQAQEKRAAKDYGGTVNSGSGNGPWRKNDVRSDKYSIECKVTGKASFRLSLKDLLLAYKQALLDGRIMLFEVEMQGHQFVTLKKTDFLAMLEDKT
ncbi:hypothetical protein AB0G15_05520 [Streptosporangium sp. NPDC023825]|uniref:hypothetical protein n=1 Tax=Streptosporangium sp. NPDC023825 TaxID=3154909 RepID=UPI00341623F3